MEIRIGGINRIPSNILAVIATPKAIVYVGKKCLAGESSIVMTPKCSNRHDKSKFPMSFLGH